MERDIRKITQIYGKLCAGESVSEQEIEYVNEYAREYNNRNGNSDEREK